MEKISRIIPANHRTKSAEVATAQPARPGAPAMGRTMGRHTPSIEVNDKVTLSNLEKTSPAANYRPSPDATRAKIVDDLAAKFFGTNVKTEVGESEKPKSEEVTDLVQS